MAKNIVILELGGTICCAAKESNSEFYSSPEESIDKFINELGIKDGITYKIEIFLKKISHEFTELEIINLCKKIQNILDENANDGLVVVMGTNALEDIAYLTGLVVQTKKPIVFTGSHFPQNSLNFDGKKNLHDAILIASSDDASMQGVLVTFNGFVISARDATKNTPGMINNFTSEGNGVVGHIVGSDFFLKASPNYKHTYQSDFSINKINFLQKIIIIYAHIGMDDLLIKAAISTSPNIKGIISAGFGKGYQSKNITNTLYQATLKNIVVVRCARLGFSYTNIDPSYDERNRFIVAKELSPHKCSLLLAVALNFTNDRDKLQKIFKEY